jgi:hypothetical protein
MREGTVHPYPCLGTKPFLRIVGSTVLRECVKTVLRFSGVLATTSSELHESSCFGIEGIRASPAMPGHAVVLRIEPPMASRPFGVHR